MHVLVYASACLHVRIYTSMLFGYAFTLHNIIYIYIYVCVFVYMPVCMPACIYMCAYVCLTLWTSVWCTLVSVYGPLLDLCLAGSVVHMYAMHVIGVVRNIIVTYLLYHPPDVYLAACCLPGPNLAVHVRQG